MHIEEAELKSFLDELGLGSPKDLTESDLSRAKAYLLGIPFVDLKGLKLDFSTLSFIPEPVARTRNAIAYKKSDDSLEVALLNIDNLSYIENLKGLSGLKLLPRITDTESMKSALIFYQKSLVSELGDSIQKGVRGQDGGKLLDALLQHAFLQGASDIHLEPEGEQAGVRYRIGGNLFVAMVLPKKSLDGMGLRIKELAGLKKDVDSPQEGRFKFETDGERIACRVSTLPTVAGEKLSINIFGDNQLGFTLESLGFRDASQEILKKVLSEMEGLVLVSGPRGGGKSTTLYTMLDILNTPHNNISTIEERVEYRLPRVNQAQAKAQMGLSLAQGLRALLRQDPDVVMVSDVGEKEVLNIALSAGQRQILLLTALVSQSAATTITQLLDLKADPLLLSANLKAVVNQRLVKKLPEKKTKYLLTPKELSKLGKVVDLERLLKILRQEKVVGQHDTWEKIPFYKSKEKSAELIGIQEVLSITPTIKELIMKGTSAKALEDEARKEGMLTLMEDGVVKAVAGIVSLEDLYEAVSE